MRKLVAVAVFLAVFCLSGCQNEENVQTAPAEMVTLRFWNGAELIAAQDVELGQMPLDVVPGEIPGMRFLGWDRELTPACQNEDYYGVFVPVLSNHVPYIFPREDGFLYPNAPFTMADLSAALDALGAKREYTLYPEEEGLTAEKLGSIMTDFFPDKAEEVLSPFDPEKVLTRGEAAGILNSLLGRENERVQVSGDACGFWDLTPELPEYADLMEAACPHEQGDTLWADLNLSSPQEPGWVIRQGRAMLFDEKGHLVRNTVTEDGLTLDADGFQTSGNRELDALVAELLWKFQKENPESSREELLRTAYLYVRDESFYLRKESLDFGATGWETGAAIEMLATWKGNCYNYAAAFWALAQGLGYKAEAVSGTIGERQDPHGWTELKIDGEIYYCDPESEMVELSWGNNWNFYMLSLYQGSNFNYRCARNVWGGER